MSLGSLVRAPAIVVHATSLISDVRKLLLRCRVPAIAVVDSRQSLRGIVTRTDVLRSAADDAAADAMSGFVFALPADASIQRAAALMAYEGVGQVVVTDRKGALVGMVSAVDIARHYALESGYLVD